MKEDDSMQTKQAKKKKINLSFRSSRLFIFLTHFILCVPRGQPSRLGAWTPISEPRRSQAPTSRRAPRKATTIATTLVAPLTACIWSERYLHQIADLRANYAELCMNKICCRIRCQFSFDTIPSRLVHWHCCTIAPSARLHFPCLKRRIPSQFRLLSTPRNGAEVRSEFHAYPLSTYLNKYNNPSLPRIEPTLLWVKHISS